MKRSTLILLILAGLAALLLVAGLLLGGSESGTKEEAPATANLSTPAPAAEPEPTQPRPAVSVPQPKPPAASDWVGEYEGIFEGDAGGTLAISMGSNRLLQVRLEIGAPGCVGQIEFRDATPRGDVLELTEPTEVYDQCKLTLRRSGNRIAVDQEGCTAYHGFSCSFDGEASK